MKKRILSILLAVCLAVSLCTGLSGMAFADGDTQEYVIKNGDTVINVCKDLGLNFYTCRQAIMILNNFGSDAAFNNMKVGDVIKLPKTDADAAKIVSGGQSTGGGSIIPEGSTVKVTVKAGDTVGALCKAQGVNYDKYYKAIMYLNNYTSVAQLSKIYVGQIIVLPTSDAAAEEIAKNYTPVTPTPVGPVVPTGDTVKSYFVPHTMRSGESLSSVCAALGANYAANEAIIVAMNGIKNVNRIFAGTVVMLPSAYAPASGNYIKIVNHKVVSGESTYSICRSFGIDYGKNVDLIQLLNPNQKLSAIKAGQILVIPVPATANVGPGGSGSTTGTGTGTGSAPTPSPVVVPLEKGSLVRIYKSGAAPDGFTLRAADNSVIANGAQVKVGDTIKVEVSVPSGYEKKISVTWAGGAVTVTDDSFVVPGGDVTVTVSYIPKAVVTVSILAPDVTVKNANGVSIVSGASVNVGDKLTVTALDKPGYTKKISVTLASGAAIAVSDAGEFTVPAGNVKVNVSYVGKA